MDTQFGLAHVWAQGDGVTRTVALILLAMSVVSWLVIVIKALDLRQHRAQASRCEAFWHAADFEAGLQALGDAANPFRHLVLTGRNATLHLNAADPIPHSAPHLRDQLDLSDWVTRELRNGIDEFTARLQGGMAILASVGSTAPFVGLFGTVWGIYHALMAIGMSGQGTLDKVAGPVGEALIMTAIGLAVAIPAAIAYNTFARANRNTLSRLNSFAYDVFAFLATGIKTSPMLTDARATSEKVIAMARAQGIAAAELGQPGHPGLAVR
jgi:biopolymer transport protein ExbB